MSERATSRYEDDLSRLKGRIMTLRCDLEDAEERLKRFEAAREDYIRYFEIIEEINEIRQP